MTQMPRCTCLRCGKVWIPKSDDTPKTCPAKKCRSPYWNIPRKIKRAV